MIRIDYEVATLTPTCKGSGVVTTIEDKYGRTTVTNYRIGKSFGE